jgi:translation elongation factor EF-Tu-like GTPase
MPSLTRSFERAIVKAAMLPDDEQDTLAALILSEIEDARHWDEQFGDDRSPAILERLAAEARLEDDADLTQPIEELLAEVDEETPEPPKARG